MPDTDALDYQPQPASERNLFVSISIVIVALIFAGMVALIYYRGTKYKEPNALVVVQADPYFDGALVTLEGGPIPHPLVKSLAADPAPEQDHICRFSIPPGMYSLRIEFKGKLIQEKTNMIINEYQIASLHLNRPEASVATTNPVIYP